MPDRTEECVWRALESFHIEIPSWGFANTGTRFGKFLQAGAATSMEEKFADAGQVHQVDGRLPHSGAPCVVGFARRRCTAPMRLHA